MSKNQMGKRKGKEFERYTRAQADKLAQREGETCKQKRDIETQGYGKKEKEGLWGIQISVEYFK